MLRALIIFCVTALALGCGTPFERGVADSGVVDVPEAQLELDAAHDSAADADALVDSALDADAETCVPRTIWVGALAAAAWHSTSVDFDLHRATSACVEFVTDNAACETRLLIGSAELCFGPCDPNAPSVFGDCKPIAAASGVLDVTLLNEPCSSGCQSGMLADAVIELRCPDE